MFLTLLSVTLLISAVVSALVALVFTKPIERILKRVVGGELAPAWHRYVVYAIYVAGISSGVRISDLKDYMSIPASKDAQVLTLNAERWALEIYRAIIESLQGAGVVLWLFFVFAFAGLIVLRRWESRRADPATEPAV